MKNCFVLSFLVGILLSCGNSKTSGPSEGIWRAELEVMDGQLLPFNFKLMKSTEGKYTMEVYNADEIIRVDEIDISKDSIVLKTPVFEGYLAGRFTKNNMNGTFIKESLDRTVPFTAIFDEATRFEAKGAPEKNVAGNWETKFSPGQNDEYVAKGIFAQKGNKITGTFETITGDYRYLEGIMDGDSMKVSAFDGAHAFLFTAKATDSTLNGIFYSGNHFKEPFVAKRNNTYTLPSTDSLTFIKEGYDKIAFTFPNAKGEMISLTGERFKDKVVLVQIMGSWCPNCLDETKFYSKYLKENPKRDLEIVALAFEYAKTKEKAFKSIDRLTQRIGATYPFLLAQYGTSDKEEAQKKLPMLNHVLSYPTTIFIDRKGEVRKIHTGFNGPATGKKYEVFKKEFDAFVKELLAERDL